MYVLFLAVAVAVAAMAALWASRLTRGRRRLMTQRFGVYLALPAFTALFVLLPLQLRLSFGDGLSLAGLVLSLIFGMGARALDMMTSRLRVGIVIPSRAPFHTELRQGLKEALAPVRLTVYDDYLNTSQAAQRLSEFLPALRRTINWRPDYLVVHSPSVQFVSTDQVIGLLRTFVRQGGGIIFIDNQPTEEARPRLGTHLGMVTSDVENGARIIADYVSQNMQPDDEVLVLCGPPSSAPAVLRRTVLTEALPKATIKVADSNGWTAESAYAATRHSYAGGADPRFIICGNDQMSFGAVRAVREARRAAGADRLIRGEVIGYDGIARALFAIADAESPLVATICTPPAAYGHEIAAMIQADAWRMPWQRWATLSECRIPVSEGQLVTRYNVELVLDG